MFRVRLHLSVPQICVSSKKYSDIIRGIFHPLHDHAQLFHALFCMALTAFEVGRHQTQLMAFENHLVGEKRHSENL